MDRKRSRAALDPPPPPNATGPPDVKRPKRSSSLVQCLCGCLSKLVDITVPLFALDPAALRRAASLRAGLALPRRPPKDVLLRGVRRAREGPSPADGEAAPRQLRLPHVFGRMHLRQIVQGRVVHLTTDDATTPQLAVDGELNGEATDLMGRISPAEYPERCPPDQLGSSSPHGSGRSFNSASEEAAVTIALEGASDPPEPDRDGLEEEPGSTLGDPDAPDAAPASPSPLPSPPPPATSPSPPPRGLPPSCALPKVPTAHWQRLDDYCRPSRPPPVCPEDYAPYQPSNMCGMEDEYEMDSEDDAFCERHRHLVADDDMFIRMFRLLDRCYMKEAADSLAMPEDDDRCVVCGLEDTYESNEMVYCDCCNIAVHQKCYGIITIPQGSWFCLKCINSSTRTIRCEFCPSRVGAFKRTSRGNWGHVVCAQWIPQLGFNNADFVDVIVGEERLLPHRRNALTCMVCDSEEGVCIRCCARGCEAAYHVTCAMQRDYDMFVPEEEGTPRRCLSYCPRHSLEAEEAQKGRWRRRERKGALPTRKSAYRSRDHDRISSHITSVLARVERYFHTLCRARRIFVRGMKDVGLQEGEEYTDDEDLDNVVGTVYGFSNAMLPVDVSSALAQRSPLSDDSGSEPDDLGSLGLPDDPSVPDAGGGSSSVTLPSTTDPLGGNGCPADPPARLSGSSQPSFGSNGTSGGMARVAPFTMAPQDRASNDRRLRTIFYYWVCKKQAFSLEQYCRYRRILRGMKKRDVPAAERTNLSCSLEWECAIIKKLRFDLEKMRVLVDIVRTREKVKRLLLLRDFDVFMQAL
eukprot:EG_transcript_2304